MSMSKYAGLSDANVVIVYNLSRRSSTEKTRFHNELYGRHNDGVLAGVPHRKLGRSVIEIPQRNFAEILAVFYKYDVDHDLRITIPVKEPDQIAEIVERIKDQYEEALDVDSWRFGDFVSKRLEENVDKSIEPEELEDERLALIDTIQKWVSKHDNDPLAEILAYITGALQIDTQDEQILKSTMRRVSNALKSWIVGYQVLQESKDSESLADALKRYKSLKEKANSRQA